jgi:hypothetical protein
LDYFVGRRSIRCWDITGLGVASAIAARIDMGDFDE